MKEPRRIAKRLMQMLVDQGAFDCDGQYMPLENVERAMTRIIKAECDKRNGGG